jgi:rod shape-determining protein MreD
MLPVLAVVAWGLVRNRSEATWWALVLGYLMDWGSPTPFGTYLVPMMVAAAIVAAGGSTLFPSNFLMPGVVAAVATAGFTLTQRALVAAMSRGTMAWNPAAIAEDVIPVVALDLLWLPALYFPLKAVARRIGPPRIEWER